MDGSRFPIEASQNYGELYNPSASEIKQLLAEIRKVEYGLPPPTVESVCNGDHKRVVQHILSNGMTIGEFYLWYMVKRKDDY